MNKKQRPPGAEKTSPQAGGDPSEYRATTTAMLRQAVQNVAASFNADAVAAVSDANKRAQLLTALIRALKLLRDLPSESGGAAPAPEAVACAFPPLSVEAWERENQPRFGRPNAHANPDT